MAPVFVKRYGGGKGKVELYGLKIDQSQNAVTIEYIEDNENYIPAGIDGVTGAFDYGSWADAFFMQIRPCMLKYDGMWIITWTQTIILKRQMGVPLI